VLGLGLGAGIGNYRSLSREIVLMSGINGRCLIAWMPVASRSWVGLRHSFFSRNLRVGHGPLDPPYSSAPLEY
jgi:hypothetical protein